MTPEEKRLLSAFDSPLPVESASRIAFGQSRHFAVPTMVKDAEKAGLIQIMDPDGPLKDTSGIYSRELMLTDKGREAVGLPAMTGAIPKPKKSAQGSFQWD